MSDDMQSPAAPTPLTAKLFSTELLIWMAGLIFALGLGYAALSHGTEANTKAISEIQSGQKELVKDISQIKISISSIGATQAAISARIQGQQATMGQRMNRQEADIRDILGILRKEHVGGGR